MASEIMEKILHLLSASDEVESLDLAEQFGIDHQRIIGAIKSLQAVEGLVEANSKSKKEWVLTEEGQHILEHGSHEAVVFHAVPSGDAGASQRIVMSAVTQRLKPFVISKLPSDLSDDSKDSEAQKKIEQMFKVGLSKALAASWIELDKNGSDTIVKRKVPAISDNVQKHLRELQTLSDDSKKDYKKRKLIKENTIKIVVLSRGPNFSTQVEKAEADLTADLLVNDAWKTKNFKPINLNALGAPLDVGHLHPLMKVRSEFRKIFLEMGFEEMPTNNYVENSFWNFDALFQPQQHPARDAHDTFFISDPPVSTSFPEDYLEKVKKVHSIGGYGSQGYGYDWKIEEAQKNLLRTHTTAVSARMLYRLMKKGKFEPVRYFSIDRVFRNETLDATHLAEFHQVEGVIADYDLTLGDLIGTLYAFFSKLGITKLEFKPAYNPYTEPSMEIFCFHEGLGKWIEIGNSGIFRPEMLLPMGLPENVNVIAWGLSLERPTMIKYGLNNIRDLVGPKVDLQMVQNNPLCRLDKCSTVARSPQLEDSCLPEDQPVVHTVESDLVMFCNVDRPPVYLRTMIRLLSNSYHLTLSVHRHSSVPANVEIPRMDLESTTSLQELPEINLVLIWVRSEKDCSCLRLVPGREIRGQVNIARCLGRLIEMRRPELLKYESLGSEYAAQVDQSLSRFEVSETLISTEQHGTFSEHGNDVSSTKYFFGNEMSLVDVFME